MARSETQTVPACASPALATMTEVEREQELLTAVELLQRWQRFALVRRRDAGTEELWSLRDGALWCAVVSRLPAGQRNRFTLAHSGREARLWSDLLGAARRLDAAEAAADRSWARRALAAACRRYRQAATPPRDAIPAAVRRAVLAAWTANGRRCGICGEAMATGEPIALDHLVPVSRGGATTAANLRVAHTRCNERRGAWHWDGEAPLEMVQLRFERPHPSPCSTLACRLCGAPALGYVDVDGLPTLRLCPAHQGWPQVRALLAGYGVPEAVLARVRYDGRGMEAARA